MRRIFLAINLPDKIKDKIIKRVCDKNLLRGFYPKEKIHLTLVFLGYLKDEDLGAVERVCADIVRHTEPFSLYLEKAILMPKNKMIWGVFKPSKALKNLQERLKLGLENALSIKGEKRPYWPHLTFLRLKSREWPKSAKIWQKERRLGLSFPVKSIEIMESTSAPTFAKATADKPADKSKIGTAGRIYEPLKSFGLGK